MRSATITGSETDHTMQCMEVWGGNHAVDNGVVMPGLDAWVFAKPLAGDIEGGDIHYVSSCATGRITRLLVADVAGHGAGVAQTANELRALMKRYVNYLDQTRFFDELNARFSGLTDSGGFATAFAATYWAPTSYLLACNAGHPAPLWRCGATGRWRLLNPENARTIERREGLTNLPLGVTEPTVYEQFGVRLRKGDLALLYTDALIETPTKSGGRLGVDGLLEVVEQVNDLSPEGFIRELRGLLEALWAEEHSDDDMTMMLLRRNEMKPRMRPSDWVTAVRMYCGALGSSIRGARFPWPEWRLETVGGVFSERLNRRWGGGEPTKDPERE
jgi:hypothetical protein